MYVKIKKEYPPIRGLKVKEVRALSMIQDLDFETGGEYQKYFNNLLMKCFNFDSLCISNRPEIVMHDITKDHKLFFEAVYKMTFGLQSFIDNDSDVLFIEYLKSLSFVKTEDILENIFILMTKTNNSAHDISEMLYSDFSFYLNKLQ